MSCFVFDSCAYEMCLCDSTWCHDLVIKLSSSLVISHSHNDHSRANYEWLISSMNNVA